MSGLELHEAATQGDYDTLGDLLRTGKYDVNMRDAEWLNRTPLHWACAKGYVECIRVLLEHGAKGTARMDMGWTPAHCAAEAGKVTVLRALHALNVPVDRRDKYGDPPRRLAEVYGHADCVNFLLQAEEEITARRLQQDRSEGAPPLDESSEEELSEEEEDEEQET